MHSTSTSQMILWIALPIVILIAVLVVLKFAAKQKWLTSICASVLLASASAVFIIRALPIPNPLIFIHVFLLLDAVCATILLIQFFRWLFTPASSQASVNPAERNRILKMVEDGKMTSDEAKELLDALGKSSALRGEENFSRMDILMLASVALVVLGFFLPWVYIRVSGMSGYQAGYQTGAIGWTLFIIAIASVVPVFITPRNFLYKISMLQIFLTLIGIILAISLMIRAGSHLGAGIVLCLIGFILALSASAAKLKTLAA